MFRAPLCPSSGAHDDSVGYRILSGPKAVTVFDPETLPSYLHLSFHPTATQEPDGLCGNQRYRRELLTLGTVVPETC